MKEIESESKFIWKFILLVLLTPITLIQVIMKKKNSSELFRPFTNLFRFIFEPKFTITIIIINIIIFIISAFLNEGILLSLVNYPSDILNFRFHTLITSGFLHADIIHLLGNMLGIFIFGRVVERKLGSGKTAMIYFGALILSGIFNSLIHIFILGENIGGIGASGALMGLVSAAILLDPFYLTYELIIPIPVMIIGWITIYADITGIINPTQDGIGHFAHIGGFVSIALLTYLLEYKNRKKMKKGLMINAASLFVGLLIYFLLFY